MDAPLARQARGIESQHNLSGVTCSVGSRHETSGKRRDDSPLLFVSLRLGTQPLGCARVHDRIHLGPSSVSGFRAECQFFDLYNFSSCGITVV